MLSNLKYILFVVMILISFISIHAQDTLNQPASPKGGVNQLAIHYYGIEFTKLQREQLKDKEIEFIFTIDVSGKSMLAEVNGITDPDIIDSLIRRTEYVEHFNPQIRNGIAEEAIYFMQLRFPSYRMTAFQYGMVFSEAKLEDFEFIEKSGVRFDMLFGGLANQFIGTPSEYLSTGGGMKVDISVTDKRQLIYGFNMSFYGNRLKKDYPINSLRVQNSGPPTLLVGLIFGKWFDKFSLQGELNFAIQNVTPRIDENDRDWVQLRGWSPGLIINYPIKLGRESPLYYYGSPALISHRLNVHFGLRYVCLSLREASGIMTELGLSYRMGMEGIKSYKLKDEFLNR